MGRHYEFIILLSFTKWWYLKFSPIIPILSKLCSVICSYHFNFYWLHSQQLCYFSNCIYITISIHMFSTLFYFPFTKVTLTFESFYHLLILCNVHSIFLTTFSILRFFWLLLIFFLKMLYIQVALILNFIF